MAALQTVQKIGPVLDLFTVQRPEWGVTEVAGELGLPRSSAHALLASLVDIGLLQCRARGRYRIGWRVVELNQTLHGTIDVKTCAAPILQALSDEYGETTHLAIMERYRVMYVDKVLGNHVINVSGARVGTHLDAHCSAVGKVLLAQCHTSEIERNITDKPLRRLTSSTITDPAALHRELQSVLRNGCAYDTGETVAEVHCVAAPIRDEMGVVVAAMSVTAPETRFKAGHHEFRRAVIAAAGAVSKSLVAAVDKPFGQHRDDPAALRAVAG